MLIDILCKVVDNFGDIGVAYRLARALSALPEAPRLRLIVDDLTSFAALEPEVDPSLERQTVRGWEVFGWELSPAALEAFAARPVRALIQCFACPRPDWLEALLFDPNAPESLMIDLDYLTAEAYAAEFHLMSSLTRSSRVAKAMFHPGFNPGTGGLILDPPFVAALELAASQDGRETLRREILAAPAPAAATAVGAFWTLVFSYERDYSRVVADLAAFHERLLRGAGYGRDRAADGRPANGRGLLVFVAAGKSRDCFLSAWREAGESFPVVELPFLPQEEWDRLLLACDFAIVRGEDSWSRAALSGRPFLWQAYPQDERYHMVKVEAFLERLKPHFAPADFDLLAAAYRSFNDRDRDDPKTLGDESILPLLEAAPSLTGGFRDFSASVLELGDLAASLVGARGREARSP
jgi:uncharacterized repeat protein (TIGR03837 family)